MPAVITKIDKAAAKRIADDAVKALAAVAEKHGLTVTYKGGTFGNATFVPKFEFAVAGADRQTFASLCTLVGPLHLPRLEADDFGREVRIGQRTFRITGVNLRAPKFPIQAVDVADGKTYKLGYPGTIAAVVEARAA